MTDRTQEQIMEDWAGDVNAPLVSVRCTAYNHEPYIAQALDGFLLQRTNFPFEVIVHDDASTDKTADIIREYEKKYPKIIRPIYQTENQYSKRDGSIGRIMTAACRGRYIALCEGDDYWIDGNKLQMQVDFLEANREYSAYYSNVEGIDAMGRPFDYAYLFFPLYSTHSILMSDTHYYPLIGQLATCMVRKEIMLEMSKADFQINGDMVLSAIARAKGNVYYSGEKLACHRKSFVGDSWTARTYQKDLTALHYKFNRNTLIFSRDVLGKEYSDGDYYLSKFILFKLKKWLAKFDGKDGEELRELLDLCDFKMMLPFYWTRAVFEKIFKLNNSRRKICKMLCPSLSEEEL